MKRIFTILWFMLALMSVNANEEGHFFVDLSSQNVALTTVANSFGSYFSYANGSTFTLFRDTTDALGIRHQSYQQYYQGKEVEFHVVIVHSKNGIVGCINGSAMTQSQAPQSVVARISKRQAAAKAPKEVEESSVTSIITCIDGMYYSVYKILSPETFEILYIDSNTGEIIYREGVFRNADVVGRGYTRYNGWQNMTVYESDGKYYLMDEGRNIVTMSAETASPNYDYYGGSYINSLPQDVQSILFDRTSELWDDYRKTYLLSPLMADYIQNSCKALSYDESDFYLPILKSITISSAASSWWYDIWDTKPDLYCEIYDNNGNLIYITVTKSDCTLPVTFTLPYPVAVGKGYVIKIYDDDTTSDSYGGSVSITSITEGMKTWSGSNTSGYLMIDNNPIEYSDIHWGMQKTLDFYQSKFGRNSFDGKGHIVINLAFPPHDQEQFMNMPNNAAQDSFEPYYMYYGWGDGVTMNPVVGIDVMAHEFTHMVTGHNGNGGLDYKLESGALNESFSDIMAMGVMQYTFGNCDWTIGADIMISAPNMRSMSNPKNSGGANGDTLNGAQPDTYKGQCWSYIPAVIDSNQIVVHRNSGVQNYWFYLLSEGGSGTNDYNHAYNITGIGMSKALDISFRNLIFYLAPNATFEDSRNGSIQAAIDLYGKDSQEHQSVENAWHAVGVGGNDQAIEDSITVKAKMPSTWGTTISAWIWEDGSNGSWATLTKDGEWYSYTTTVNPLNIVFVNGYTWNGDSNQSVDISVTENTCIQLNSNGTNKCTYTVVDCPDEDEITPPAPDCKSIPFTETFASSQGDFTTQNVILPDGLTSIWNWDTQYGMVAKAINGSTKYKSEAWLISPCIELPEEQNCVLTFSHAAKFFSDTDQMTLYLTTDYITEAPGESNWEQLIIPTYPTGTNWNWFESGEIDLSAYKGEHIVVGFRYVSNTNYAPQWEIKNFAITQSGTTPVTSPVESNRYIVLAQRDASSNWFYMTSDLGSASTKRYQAVDAGTNVLANISNLNLADKYYWEIEDNKLKTAAGYSTWTSGNSANLNATGKDLTIQQQADGTYTFSFADGSDTRYLSLNKTAGNDYFAYYKGTAQVYKLTLVKEGTTTPTAIENTSEESLHDSPIRKVIEDGQLYIILPNGTRYTATGAKVE